jgi:hypothetical protein
VIVRVRESKAFLVGAAGFEPTTCSTQSSGKLGHKRSERAK